MHGVEHEGEEDDEEAGHRHEDRPGAVPQGDGAVRAAADRYRAAPSPLEDLVLEARDLGEAGGGRREQEPQQVAQQGRLEKLRRKLTFVFIVHAPFLPSMSAHSSVSSEWFSGKFHHLQIERGFLLKFTFIVMENFDISPLAVSLTTSIIRSRKLVHPTAASCVRAGPKAFVKYSKTTPFMNFKNQIQKLETIN